MATKRGPKLPPYVQRVRTARGWRYRGWWMENDRRCFGPLRDTPEEAHQDSMRQRGILAGPLGRLTLADAIQAVRMESAGLAEKTRAGYEERWKVLTAAFDETKWLDSFTPEHVEWFIGRRLARGASPSTVVEHDLKALSRLFNLAHARGLLPRLVVNPVLAARKPAVEEPLRAVLPWVEAMDVVDTLRESGRRQALVDAGVLDLLLHTGLRKTEAARLLRSDVDAHRMVVRGKTGRRVLPLPDRLAELLAAVADHDRGDGVLPGATEQRRRDLVRRACERWAERLDMPAIEPHAMRRTFATELRRRRVPREVIADLLGHKRGRDSVTDLYLGTFDPELHRALELLWGDEGWT